MAYPIPKIEFKNYTVTGNKNGTAIISGMTSTANLEAGMFCKGSGVPVGATVLTVDSSTQVTLTAAITGTASGVSFDFGFAIEFDYPLVEPSDERRDAQESVSISRSGVRQVSVSYIEIKRVISARFISQSIKLLLDTFMDTHALYGKSFRYFHDKTLTSYVTYELGSLKYDPRKISPKGVDVFVWEIALEFRRAA